MKNLEICGKWKKDQNSGTRNETFISRVERGVQTDLATNLLGDALKIY